MATDEGDMKRGLLDDINERMHEVFAQSPAADLEKNMRSLLATFFSRLELVTREEFDVQRRVLLRTREKLERLEVQLAELERKHPPQSGSSRP
jgi:ubiquinone biosynthesis accessory factor UbiK